jgi:hypothetical protein
MKKLFVMAAAVALLSSCINLNINGGKAVICKGPVVEKEMEGLTDFSGITANGSVDLYFSQTSTFSVKVKANEEVFDYLDYKVEKGELILGTKDNANIRAEEYKVTITLPEVTKIHVNGAADVYQQGEYCSNKPLNIHVNGAGDINLKEKLQVPAMGIHVNGAGDIRIEDMDVDELTIKVNGAGDAVLGGKAASAHFSVNGAGDIDARNLQCEKTTTQKAGLASIRF